MLFRSWRSGLAGYRPPAELKTGIKHKPPHVGRKTNVWGLFCIPVMLQERDGFGQRLAGAVVGQGTCTLGSVAQIKEHHDLFVFGQTQRFCQLVRVKKIDPAAVYAGIGSAQQQVGGHDGGKGGTSLPTSAAVGRVIGENGKKLAFLLVLL